MPVPPRPIDLYEKCSNCNGRLFVPASKEFAEKAQSIGVAPPSQHCYCVKSPTPGYSPTGLTLGQVDGIIRFKDRLLILVADLAGIPCGVGLNPAVDSLILRAREIVAKRTAQLDAARDVEKRDPGGDGR